MPDVDDLSFCSSRRVNKPSELNSILVFVGHRYAFLSLCLLDRLFFGVKSQPLIYPRGFPTKEEKIRSSSILQKLASVLLRILESSFGSCYPPTLRVSSMFSSRKCIPVGFPSMGIEGVDVREEEGRRVGRTEGRQRAQGHAAPVRESRCSGPRMEARRKEALETPSTPTEPVLLTQRRGALCPPLSRDARG